MYGIPPFHIRIFYQSALDSRVGSTNGLSSCAAINGINQVIVSRANELAALSARGENLIAACAVLAAEETQLLGEAVGNPVLIARTYSDETPAKDVLARRFLGLDLSEENASRTAWDMLEGVFQGIEDGSSVMLLSDS